MQVMITFRDQGESIVEKDVTMREDTQEGEQKEGETDTVRRIPAAVRTVKRRFMPGLTEMKPHL